MPEVCRAAVRLPSSPDLPPPLHCDLSCRQAQLLKALRLLGQLHEPANMDDMPDEDFTLLLHSLLPYPDHFVPGLLKHHFPIWQTSFELASRCLLAVNQLLVLKIMGEGVWIRFVHPNSQGKPWRRILLQNGGVCTA